MRVKSFCRVCLFLFICGAWITGCLTGLWGFGVLSKSFCGISGGQLLDGKQYLILFRVLPSQTFCSYWKDAKSLRLKKKKKDKIIIIKKEKQYIPEFPEVILAHREGSADNSLCC